jgi:D-alanine-D-alanine ligase
MPEPTVLILYNQPVLPAGHADAESELEIVITAASVRRVLTAAGHRVRELGVGADMRPLVALIQEDRPDVVFNLFEGLGDRNHTETTAAGLLDWLGVPYTGSPPDCLALARHKVRTKQLLRGAGVPTPPFLLLEGPAVPPCPLDWPVIVKPALQDASVGIEQASVVTSQRQLVRRVRHVLERFGPPVLVERFIFGRELFVSLVEVPEKPGAPLVLPLAEILFTDDDPNVWPIYSYDAKWREQSREYLATPLWAPVELEPAVLARVAGAARAAYRLTGCRDYARVDVRLTADGRPYVLEVNPNPFLNSLALINGLEAVGRHHADFIVNLVRLALGRRDAPAAPAPPPPRRRKARVARPTS